MTREERTKLIRHLKYNRSIGADYLITDEDTDEIIKALEQGDVLDKIRAEITELRSRQNVGVLECLDIIEKYKKKVEV